MCVMAQAMFAHRESRQLGTVPRRLTVFVTMHSLFVFGRSLRAATA